MHLQSGVHGLPSGLLADDACGLAPKLWKVSLLNLLSRQFRQREPKVFKETNFSVINGVEGRKRLLLTTYSVLFRVDFLTHRLLDFELLCQRQNPGDQNDVLTLALQTPGCGIFSFNELGLN